MSGAAKFVEQDAVLGCPKSRRLPMWHRFFRDLPRCKVACCVLLASSFLQSGALAEARPVKSLLEMRRENVVVQEWDISCGAAALATLLHFRFGDSVAERDIAKALVRRAEYVADPMLVRARQGYSLLDLKRYVDSRGYKGIGYGKMSLEDLIGQPPVIVPIDANGYKHFVIFRGVARNRVLLADPAWGNRTMPIEKFEAMWLDYPELGKVGFVVVEQEETNAAPNRLAPRPEEFLILRSVGRNRGGALMDGANVAGRGGQPAVIAILMGALSGLVYGAGGAMPVEAAPPDPSVRALQRQLEQRDAVIEDLQRRVQELERRTGGAVKSTTPNAEATPGADAATPEQAAQGPAAPTEEQKAAEAPPTPEASAPAPAPGQVTVTEEETERALERTLVATGVLLLPFGQLEIEPAFTYTRREFDSSEFDLQTARAPKIRRNEFQPSISARAGLPLDSQLELDLPYNVVQQDQIRDLITGRDSRTDTGHGIGDLSVGIAKTVFQEKGWRPDLIARFSWDTATGPTQENGVLLDSGFNEIIGQLTALKRQDPLAFFASAFYQKAFEENDIEPGDEVGFSLGAFLATSPETSLGLSLNQIFSDDDKINGTVDNDSGQVSAVLNLGVSSLLAPGVLLLLNAGIGLTDESPDYAVTISLPIRFGVPGL